MTNAPVISYSDDLFVARQSNINAVITAIEAAQRGMPAARTVIFTGERGIGKSWLLTHLREHELPRQRNLRIYAFDLIQYAQETPEVAVEHILEDFREKIIGKRGNLGTSIADKSRTVIDELHRMGGNQTLVVLADSVYESDWNLLAVLEDYFLGPLAIEPRVVIVMAGRGRAYPWSTPELGTHAEIMELEKFGEKDTAQQLKKLKASSFEGGDWELDSRQIDGYLKYSQGNPLVNRHLATHEDPVEALDAAIEDILTVVKPEERAKIREYLEALSVLRSFKEDRLPAMLTAYGPTQDNREGDYTDWTYAEGREVREKLTRNAFAAWKEDMRGYVISPSPKEQIEAFLKLAKHDLWVNLHCMAYHLYSLWIVNYAAAADHWREEAEYHKGVLTKAEAGWSPDRCAEMKRLLDRLEKARS